MINQTSHELDNLTDLYHSYEHRISVVPAPNDGSLKSLVTFDSSRSAAVHRWYTFKEGYSHNILSALRSRGVIPEKSGLRLLDPFCGVATTILSSHLSEDGHFKKAVGIERNPAIFFIARAKLNWQKYRERIIESLLQQIRLPKSGRRLNYSVPELSTLSAVRENGRRAFEPKAIQDLLFYREWIQANCERKPELDFFMLAWTAIIERASNTRKDGRALRLLEASETPNVKELLLAQCELMLEDLRSLRNRGTKHKVSTKVILGDGRRLPFKDDSFTALCYSPPYLNNIDYCEVYKLELWLRGDVSSRDQFYSLRLSTLRSHPSVAFPTTSICESFSSTTWIRRLKKALIAALPADKYRGMRKALFSGYIDDMLLSLREQFRIAAPESPIVCVVGNSLHGGKNNHTVPVCTDLIISAAAEAVGLEIDHLQIARQLPRRDSKNGWLRETIIIMRKPKKPANHHGK